MPLTPCDLVVPTHLFGPRAQVRRKWQRITTRALKDRTWKHALADMDYFSLAERQEDIITDLAGGWVSAGPGDFWHLCFIHDLLCRHKVGVPRDYQPLICALNWDGLRYPWFLLGAFCSQGAGHPAPEEERRRFAVHALHAIME